MIGKTFDHLTVISQLPTPSGRETWLCKCKCGNYKGASTKQLTERLILSCGCEPGNDESTGAMVSSHQMTRAPIYRSWQMMNVRCNIPNYTHYQYYGGRGIKVCERWRRFENFYVDMAPRPANGTLDRIDTDGDYEPGNCKWSTRHEQLMNRNNTLEFEFQGVKHTLVEWAVMIGERRERLYLRMYRTGVWDIAEVFEWLGVTEKVTKLIHEAPALRMLRLLSVA